MPVDEQLALDCADAKLAAANRKAGRRQNDSAARALQADGPLRGLVVPPRHSRQSRHSLLRMYLKDAIEVAEADSLDTIAVESLICNAGG